MLIAVAGAPAPAPAISARLRNQCAALPARARARTTTVPDGDTAGALIELAELATEAAANGEPLAVCAADLLVSDTPLLQVLDDPRDSSRALVGARLISDPAAVRIERNRLVSAGSGRHRLTDPSGAFLGLLLLRPADLPAAATTWRDAAAVITDQGWSDLEPVQTALLALVRSGVTLTAVPADPYLGARGPAANAELLGRVESLDEPDLAWRQASRSGDGVWSTFVLRRISRRLSRLSVRIGLTPNALTLISLVIAFGAAAMIAFGPLPAVIIGAVLLQFSLIIDCSDGEVARSTRSFTPFGAWADLTSDRLKEYLALAALAVNATTQGNDVAWLLALAGMGLQTVRHLQDYSFADTVLVWWRAPRPDVRPLTDTAAQVPPAGPSDAVTRLIGTPTGPAHWIKQALHAQIGERWLVLCAGVIIGGPLVALVAYLILVVIAELWTLTGWVLRTVTRADRAPLPEATAGLLARLRDDGVLTRVLAGRPRRPLSWLLPPLLTAIEAAVLIGLTTAIAPSAHWLAYGWLAVVACRRYDLFYRHRTGRQPLPYVISALGGGWPIRIPVLLAGALTGPVGFTWVLGVGTIWLALVVVPESIGSAVASLRPPGREYAERAPLNGPARLRLAKSVIRRGLSVPTTRLLMAITPPRRQALVGGLPDTEENSLATAVGLTRRYSGRVLLLANDVDRTRLQLSRVATLLDAPGAVGRITVIPKAGWSTYWTFVTAELVCYTHGLYDSPRPGRRRIHVNLWHGTGPKWNANANFAQRIGAQAHSASSPLWGVEAVRALSMRPETTLVAGNPRQDVISAATDRSVVSAVGIDPTRPFVLWLPTFRSSSAAGLVGLAEGEPLTAEAARAFAAAADLAGVQLITKPHRLDAARLDQLGLRVITDDDLGAASLTLYQLIGLADGMLSDYSSVWVDYLDTGRSIGLYVPDLASYTDGRGLNLPLLGDVADELIITEHTVSDFFSAVADGKCFAEDGQLRLRRRLAMITVPPGGRTDQLITDLRTLALHLHHTDLGLTP
ncbi:CDP-glycerol glycerophosphotransferase family protein [Microlunatus speluncae]|uniref:CDP-glycerol glycerophosphotransferase family protein n=1 Tax=Microlunatus speluncae TaxID=2594267 RepID=UPI0013757726|nr:CDP-glycerol glycerophosphotransferase family protein [Microlunatus speluncae]